ncbi:MAG: Dyp-type peroxidase [Burkholderiaceae bacterium]|nr:Dyp-type peroxidase [Burkholderiaceae bacterium]
MPRPQPAILLPIPAAARYLSFVVTPGADSRGALKTLATLVDGERCVAGLGASLVASLGARIAGLHSFPALQSTRLTIPSTPTDLWLWLRGDDAGELFHRSRRIEDALAPAFQLVDLTSAFRHGDGDDLTGYEDGTENPKDDEAVAAAIVAEGGAAPAGSSFVAVQRWVHRFDLFEAMSPQEQDATFGRRRDDNEEIDDAPPSAHVKRTAQESFDPTAFVVRRSMPWSDGRRAGLVFVSFGKSFDAFIAQLKRMAGLEDGIEDGLFRFTRPETGGYYWCPPVREGRLDLSALKL